MQERCIGDIAIEAIDFIMRSNIGVLGIPEPNPETLATSYTVDRNATFATVMQYLWTYVGNGAPRRSFQFRYYPRDRILRYKSAINTALPRQEQIQHIQHIDLGCGGGTFAHALLEWCQARDVEFDKVSLFGYDYAPQMIRAANQIHNYIQQFIRSHYGRVVPNLYVYSNYESMLKEVPAEPSEATRYIITAGYALANNLDSQTTEEFASIIGAVVRKAGNHPCSLIVYDSNTVRPLAPAYNMLVSSLQASSIGVDTRYESTGERIAGLHRQGA